MSLNLYTYCANNPLIYHDPTGHKYEFSKFWNNLRKDIRNSAHSVNKSVRNNINSVKKSISNSSVGKITDKFIKDTKKTLAGGIRQVSGLKSFPSAISGAFSSIGKAIKDIPKANWKQNSGILRSIMNEGIPIKDVSMFPMDNAGFLGAERNLLQSRGWTYLDGYWYPTTK